jgi:hypothetical protein
MEPQYSLTGSQEPANGPFSHVPLIQFTTSYLFIIHFNIILSSKQIY